jgi:hypothetical protein
MRVFSASFWAFNRACTTYIHDGNLNLIHKYIFYIYTLQNVAFLNLLADNVAQYFGKASDLLL